MLPGNPALKLLLTNQVLNLLSESPDNSLVDKSLPTRHLLLLQILTQLSETQRNERITHLLPQIEISKQSCSGCTGCVGFCPTGTLLPPVNVDEPPAIYKDNRWTSVVKDEGG